MFVLPPYAHEFLNDTIFEASPLKLALQSALIIYLVWLMIHKIKPKRKFTKEERDEKIRSFKPEPLVTEIPEDHPALHPRIVTQAVGKRIIVDGHNCLNLASNNYLGLLEDENIRENAIKSIKKYGVGSCGPRGFYGTLDVHLELEERLAKFMEMEEAVVYSYAFSTIASAIPAYSKRNDIIFVDECVNFAIQKGLDASRSRIVFFKHNNMVDLEDKLKEQAALDKKNPKKAAKTRRTLVAEGIYFNTGDMCPLRELVELRKKYKLRLFLDESVSFGTIGKHGRGLTEFLKIDKIEVDLICASLETAVGSIGGFCVGSSFIVEHQRLSGLGYCFSASQPPLLTQAAISALDRFESEPQIFLEINTVSEKVDRKFRELSAFNLGGHVLSPVKHLYLKNTQDPITAEKLLRKISDRCMEHGLAIIKTEYLDIEKSPPTFSIRIAVNRLLEDADIDFAFKVLEESSKEIL